MKLKLVVILKRKRKGIEICNLNWFGVKRKNHTSHFRNPLLNEKKKRKEKLVKGKRRDGDGNFEVTSKM